MTGRDSNMIKDQISEETSNVDWAQVLLDSSTDDMIITVSREKIAHEIIRLRTENQRLRTESTRDYDSYSNSNSTPARMPPKPNSNNLVGLTHA